MKKTIIFLGILEDIEYTKNGIIASFSCERSFRSRKFMNLRLTINESFIEKLRTPYQKYFRSLNKIYIIAKIKNVYHGYLDYVRVGHKEAYDDRIDVSLKSETLNLLTANGELVDILHGNIR